MLREKRSRLSIFVTRVAESSRLQFPSVTWLVSCKDVGMDVGKDVGMDVGKDVGMDVGKDVGMDVGKVPNCHECQKWVGEPD